MMAYIETGFSINSLHNINVQGNYSFPLLATGSNYASEATSSDASYLIVPSTVTSLSLGSGLIDNDERDYDWSPAASRYLEDSPGDLQDYVRPLRIPA